MSAPVYKPTDLVRVGVDLGAFYAEVLRTARDGLVRGRLEVRPLVRGPGGHTREVLAREVTGHWRRVR